MTWENKIGICTLPCVKLIASGKLLYKIGSSAHCSVMTEVGAGRRKAQERGNVYIIMTDSHCCMAETSTTL